MTPHDSTDDALRAAFAARLDAEPEPSDTMLARTRAALDAHTPPARGWRSATRWWTALAAPARFSTAAAIVIVSGTIVVGAFKASHEDAVSTAGAHTSRVTFERRAAHATSLAYRGSLHVAVRDVAASSERVRAIVTAQHGTIVSSDAPRLAPTSVYATRLVLRVPTDRLTTTLRKITQLGRPLSQAITSDDLASAIAATARNVAVARAAQTALATDSSDAARLRRSALAATIAQLRAQQRQLEQRATTATIAVVLQPADEPSPLAARPTSNPLARGIWFAAHGSTLACHRVWPLALASSGGRAVITLRAGAATAGNDRPARTRNPAPEGHTTAAPDANASTKPAADA